jgi:hypothetical protein
MPKATAILVLSALLLVAPAVVHAQPRGRLSVGPTLESYAVSADDVGGTTAATGIVLNVRVNPLLDFEAELLKPIGTLSREYTGTSFSVAPPGASLEEIQRLAVVTRYSYERRVDAVLSFGAAFHPRRAESRFEPRLFTGITTHFARSTASREPLRWPAEITREEVLRRQPADHMSRAIGSLTFGASLAIDLTRRLVVVPDIRYDYGSIGDEINNVTRGGVRFMYRF